MLNVTVLFCVSLYPSYVYVTVQFSCYLIIIGNCQSSTFLTEVKTPYTRKFYFDPGVYTILTGEFSRPDQGNVQPSQ